MEPYLLNGLMSDDAPAPTRAENAAADAELAAWHAQAPQEATLDPEIEIVDPHHHLWDACAPLSGCMSKYIDEEGNEALGGAHDIRRALGRLHRVDRLPADDVGAHRSG